ncbi:MAG TPA: long-chain fatty acid--CoA ligase [Micromonosporaceae bacterium]|jgi:long-chain acyl-CoA synthetase|nr:long-chain fatty acid--CoA ligase [Micromonosporaceae bacterium]
MSLEIPYRCIPDMLAQRVAATPHGRAFGFPVADDGIAWMTWGEVGARAANIGAGLLDLGVRPEDRVAILSNTRVEWLLADFGIMNAGAATTTVYPTTEADEASFILGDSESVVLVAENAAQATKVSGATLEHLRHVVLIDATEGEHVSVGVPTMSLADLEQRGADALAADPDLVSRAVAAVAPDHLATVIYTSGTTGRPKGVELLHAGWCWQAVAQGRNGLVRSDDLQYLWLPLSHSFGKTLACSLVHAGLPTYVDGRVDKLVVNLARVQPTLMCAAPRVFEKVYNAAVGSAASAGGAKAKIFAWAVRVGRQAVTLELAGVPVPAGLAAQRRVADKLVFSKLRERLGGRIRVLVSGAAPLSRDISEFFAAAGLPIYEGYGLTETSAGNFVNPVDGLRIGTVGQHLGDLECKIDVDGEILIRGLPVMRGYHNLPDETAAAFTDDGFFRTGDIGELDADGYLRITDRKKDLIKTSGGKYVAPSHIEGMFKAICPYTSQALIVGQARNYCTMVVTLDPDAIVAWAAAGPLAGKPYAEIVASDEARQLVDGYVTELNEKLNRWETVKKFTILPRDLSIEHGELTPSLKVKRRAVETAFADDIEKMYEGALAEL